ncbi:MAG: hypothetical protein JXA33_10670 [Anaerolineae bacterium]|nr:hypothetical protein [Anaerolineae bacterium]
MEDYSQDDFGVTKSFWKQLPPSVRAALSFALPFILADFFNYYSAGTALAISLPLLIILYIACGALSGKFSADDGRPSSEYLRSGALAGLTLWLLSTVTNTLLSLIVGTLSLGITLVMGVPYLCLCAPVQLIGGGLFGGLGGLLFGRFFGGQISDEPDTWG